MPIQSSPAQEILLVDSIRDNTVILKNGGLRAILMCSSLNFALKSTDEQDAVIFQYQAFLNSLDFSLQFVIHSRRFNINPYLETLGQRLGEETNDLMKTQISEYIQFVKTFVDSASIMSKTFYAVIPFTPSYLEEKSGGGFLGKISSVLGFGKSGAGSAKDGAFEDFKNQLWQRVENVTAGLRRFGVRSAPLNTEELIELFYSLYNPTEFEKSAMTSAPPSS